MNTNNLTKKSFPTKRLVTDALFAALFIVFSCFLSIKLKTPSIEISPFVSLPIFLAVLLFGPADALLIALTGSFVEQLLSPYGLSATAPLWMAPVLLQAAAFGTLAFCLRFSGNRFEKTKRNTILLIILIVATEILLTGSNILVDYLDGFHISKYYQPDFLTQWLLALPGNAVNCLIRTTVSCILVYFLLPPVQKLFSMRKNS